MALYIKIENGQPISHPVLDSNLKELFGVTELNDKLLLDNNYVKFEHRSLDSVSRSTNEYELCDDGIVRNKTVKLELTQDEKIETFIRRPRDAMLAWSDWTQGNDSPLSAEKKAEWAAVRQTLRDMPTTYANIQSNDEIVWPEQPL